MNRNEDLSRKRALTIMQVRSGRITATEGARRLGISRKTYYEWEKRGLDGMMRGLENQAAGRPVPSVDTEKETMSKRIQELQQKLLLTQKRSKIKDLFLEKINSTWPFKSQKHDRVKKKKRKPGP